jgi:dTDP-4-amino-4,6-dideoxygalactose transaminase
LKSQGVSHTVHYPNLDYDQSGFDEKSEKLLNSETLKSSIISIPLFPELREDEVQAVIKALGNFSPKSFQK